MDDQYNLSVSIPTDEDGFVRQECESCGRQFKAGVVDDELVTARHCPYCGHESESWFTSEQMEYFEASALAAVMPDLKSDLDKMTNDFNRGSGGFITMSVSADEVESPAIAVEPNDMVVADFPCCGVKVKADEQWDAPLFCPECGKRTA